MNARVIKKYLKAARHPFGYHCTHLAKLLFDYVEGTLDPVIAAKLEKHLADCPECIEFVKTYRSTKHLCHEYGKVDREMPPELRDKLVQFVRSGIDKPPPAPTR